MELSARELARIGNRLLFAGDGIIVATTEPNSILQGAYIKLIGGFLLTEATIIETSENQFRETPIPEDLNQQKLLASMLGIIASILATDVLQKETELRAIQAPAIPPFGFVGQ